MSLNILTFNWHEPYICQLSRIKHQFLVVAPETQPGQFRHWDTRMRPVPANCTLIGLEEVQSRLHEGRIDLAIAHNIKDLVWLKEYELPKVCVFHCRLSTEIALSSVAIDRNEYLGKVKTLLEDVTPVFISQSKRDDWGLKGDVIVHGMDVEDFPQWTGERAEGLRVGNLLKEMDLARGFSLGEKIIDGFACKTLGLNPTLAGSRLSTSYEDLLEHYRTCRFYLNTLPPQYEDGYNFSLLEAMATGMPVVSTYHPDSPVVDGTNGYIADDLDFLRDRCAALLEDPELARTLGACARQTVKEQFPISRFVNSWNRLIEGTVQSFIKSRGFDENRTATPFHERRRKNILMDYVAHPATTAYYLDRAFRKEHNVITCGDTINDQVIHLWNLEALNWPIEPQDIYRRAGGPLAGVLESLPKGWQPDFYLYVETGLSEVPPDLDTASVPTACYLIDTHLHLENHLRLASRFDVVFIAQKEYLPRFREQGIENVYWLPLGCDPDIHGKQDVEKLWDVGFVGSITPANPRRKILLDCIGARFDLKVDRKFMTEMAEVFCRSRIVFNNAIKNDLNMRVFEALCSGSLLITDKANALTELFEDKKHLVVYDDAAITDTVQYYLDHPVERETIAETGRQHVLQHHTYRHRAREIISILDGIFSSDLSTSALAGDDPNLPDYYRHVRHDLVGLIPESARSVLEIGCGAGATGRHVKESRNLFWAGVELNADAAALAKSNLDDVIAGNIETLDLPYEPESFDCLFCGDVLEHLVDPQKVLNTLKGFLKKDGVLVTSIPNVQFFGVFNHLAEGNWTYQDEGILDRTHLRFFTFKEIEKLLAETGFELDQVEETLDPQYEQFRGKNPGVLKIGRVTLEELSPEELRRFFVFQYRLCARKVASRCGTISDRSETAEPDELLLKEARELEEQAEWEKAAGLYARLLELHPEAVPAMVGRANCSLKQDRLKEARHWLGRALERDENNSPALMGLGVLSLRENEIEQARGCFEQVIRIGSAPAKGHCGLGMTCQVREDWEQAMEHFSCSLEHDPENQVAMSSLVRLAWSTGKFERAEKAIKRFLEIHPANLNMCFGLAGILYEQGKLEEARDALNHILIFEPHHGDALELLEKIKGQGVQR
ncbi:MAG: glycosyltransferase [Nitrospina sp.]|nr:glycosyltransferase [Nitrospina sp.]